MLESILDLCNLSHLMVGGGYTSAGAVFSTLLRKPAHLVVIDEMGMYLEAAKANGNQNAKDANRILMEAISRCAGTLRPTEYSTMTGKKSGSEDRSVKSPAITMVGMTTPSTFYNNLDKSQIENGFLGRFIIHQSHQPRQVSRDQDFIDPPDAVAKWAEVIAGRQPNDVPDQHSLSGMKEVSPSDAPRCIILSFSPAALDESRAFNQEMVDLQNELERSGVEAIAGRTNEFAMKLALIVALANNPEADEIGWQDMDWAIQYMRFAVHQAQLVLTVFGLTDRRSEEHETETAAV